MPFKLRRNSELPLLNDKTDYTFGTFTYLSQIIISYQSYQELNNIIIWFNKVTVDISVCIDVVSVNISSYVALFVGVFMSFSDNVFVVIGFFS